MRCKKVGYLSRREANKARKLVNRHGKALKRSYQCGECGLWHLTSQSDKVRRKLRKERRNEQCDT